MNNVTMNNAATISNTSDDDTFFTSDYLVNTLYVIAYILLFIILVIASGYIFLKALRQCMKKYRARKMLHEKNFENNVVYLFAYPPSRDIVQISPFALKVATWLRINNIPYHAISTTRNYSQLGQIPFIELNGVHVADSDLIVEHVNAHFNIVEEEVDARAQAIGRMLQLMLENRTFLSYGYYRYVAELLEFMGTWTHLSNPITKMMIWYFLKKGFRSKCHHNSIGRHTLRQIYKFGMDDFRAVSNLLGDRYWVLGGESATFADAALFAHTSQIIDIPINYPHRAAIENDCQNLIVHCGRMKEAFWPDWAQLVPHE